MLLDTLFDHILLHVVFQVYDPQLCLPYVLGRLHNLAVLALRVSLQLGLVVGWGGQQEIVLGLGVLVLFDGGLYDRMGLSLDGNLRFIHLLVVAHRQ